MDAATRDVLIDLTRMDILAVSLGLIVFYLLRLISPLDRWSGRGNVYAEPFGWQELLIVVGLFGLVFFRLQAGDQPSESSAPTTEPAEGTQFSSLALLVNCIFMLGLAGVFLTYLQNFRGINVAELFGLERLHPTIIFAWSIGILLPTLLVVLYGTLLFNNAVLLPLWGDVDSQPVVNAFNESSSFTQRLMFLISAVIVAPLCEELLFRGLIYGTLKRYGERIYAALASSILFAVIHFHVPSLTPLFLLSIGFCIAYEITGCLWVPIVMHALFNAINLFRMWNAEGMPL